MDQVAKPAPAQVHVMDGRAVALSTEVAEFFGKQHKNVLRDIREFLERNPEARLNFEPSTRTTASGEEPYFVMTRAGFSMIALAFTGEKAEKFRIAYVEVARTA